MGFWEAGLLKEQKRAMPLPAEEKVEWLQQILIPPSLRDLHEVEKNT